MNKIILLSIYLTVILFYNITNAKADDITVNFGAGVFNSGINSLAETKILLIGYNDYFYDRTLFWRNEVGGFVDNAGGGRSGSFITTHNLGVNAENNLFYGQASAGLAFLGTTDSYLGGHIQFTEEVTAGINGRFNTKVGVFYKHISSAGIYDPNVGRDFFGAQINIPLF